MPRLHILAAAALAAALPGVALAALPSAEAATSVTVRTLHFKTTVAGRTCDVVGDLYLPSYATSTRRVPAILTTNGFGGSKDDQAGFGRSMAGRGYAVLSYSGLGFGGSGCKITLDDPDTDGAAGSQLVSYLGGAAGIAYVDAAHKTPAPALAVVQRDARAHDGVRRAHDPRVGMIGGSYGGQIQFAVAGRDPRVDTIVPMITWNDLSYSLAPNNISSPSPSVAAATPGAAKLAWALGFSAKGITDGLSNAQGDPSRLFPCPNFADFVCPTLVGAGVTGHLDAAGSNSLRHASVSSYVSRIKVPTLLLQGQSDTLFNLNEAAATYASLRRQGTLVRMVWHSWGHTASTPAPGEFDFNDPQPTQYESKRVLDWFDHWLRDRPTPLGPMFAWFRDWVPYTGDAAPAFASSSTATPPRSTTLYVGGGRLASSPATGTSSFLTPPAGAPTSINPLDALGDVVGQPLPEQDLPGTFAAFTGTTLTAPVDVVGSPRLTLRVQAPVAAGAQAAGPDGMLVLFVRLRDVGPDGKAHDIRQQVAPVRVPDVTRPFTVTLPALVHRFAVGHKVQLVVAGGSVNYRGGSVSQPVTITGGALRLPSY